MIGNFPKFKSFVPKVSQSAPEKSPSEKASTEETTSRKGKLSERTRHRRSHESRDARDRSESRRDYGKPTSPTREEESDLFMVDRAGDPKNLTYGSLHKYSVPRYYRAGYGSIVGLMRNVKIDRDASSTSEVVLEHDNVRPQKQRHLFTSSKTGDLRHKLVRHSDQHDEFAANSGYLTVGSRKRKRGSGTPQENTTDYRSIEGKAKASAQSDSDVTSDESDMNDSKVEHTIRQTHATLVKATQLQPSYAKGWLALIDWQSRLVHPGVDPEHFSRAQRRTLADLRLHLYEKALRVVDAGDRSSLLNAMLLEGSVLWDVPTQERKWREALDSDPGAATLWIKYLDLLQYSESPFKYEEKKSAMVDLLGHVNALKKKPQTPAATTSLEETHVHVFMRLMGMISSAGYDELAIAIIQNAITLHLRNTGSPADFPERLAQLESAWDDELPRFGENQAGTSDVAQGVESPPKSKGDMRYTAFANQERHLSRKMELPGRSIDEDDDELAADDGFHILFFSDIKDTLANTDAGLEQQLLLDAFLAFFDLPPIPFGRQGAWRTDPMLFRDGILSPDDNNMDRGDHHTSLPIVGSPLWPSSLVTCHDDFFPQSLAARPSALAFVQAGLEQLLCDNLLGLQLRTYVLAFHMHFFPATAAKRAKTLLKAYPSEAQLYNIAAHIEAISGNPEKATRIWSSSTAAFIAATKSANKESDSPDRWHDRLAALVLCHDWAWTELKRRDLPAAISALASLRADPSDMGGMDLSASTKLALHRDLSSGFDTALMRGETEHAVLHASALVLLTYLTSACSITSSLQTLTSLITTTTRRTTTSSTPSSPLLSHLHHLKIPLITTHLDAHRPHRPASLLSSVSESLALLHPSPPHFLALHARLTTTLTEILDPQLHLPLSRPWLRLDAPTTPLQNWVSAISQAQIRHERGRATPDAVRALFRRACLASGSRVAHCPGLWGQWLGFELRVLRGLRPGRSEHVVLMGRKEKREVERQVEAVRVVFFDGLRELPGDKEWVLRGLEVFEAAGPARMEERGLRALYRLLFERGMRVRVEVDEG